SAPVAAVGPEEVAEEPRVARITLTPPVLAAARHVIVTAVGGEKAAAVAAAVADGADPAGVPAALVRPSERVTWIVDRAAESVLLEGDALPSAELVRRLAEEDHGEDVRLLERWVRAEDQVGLVGRAGDVHHDAVGGRAVAGGHVEDGFGGRPAAQRDRALLDLEVPPLELEPAVQE